MRLAHETGSLLRAGIDGASDVQVLNHGVLDVAERGAVFLGEWLCGRAFGEGQRLAVAVEGALERVGIACAHHRRHADVVAQLHEVAAEGVAAVDVGGELVPVVGAADDEGSALGAQALRRPSRRHGVGRAALAGRAIGAASTTGSAVVAAALPARVTISIICATHLCAGSRTCGGSVTISAGTATKSSYIVVFIPRKWGSIIALNRT